VAGPKGGVPELRRPRFSWVSGENPWTQAKKAPMAGEPVIGAKLQARRVPWRQVEESLFRQDGCRPEPFGVHCYLPAFTARKRDGKLLATRGVRPAVRSWR
jgi:hypothetical protein